MANQLLIATPQGAQWASPNGQLSIGPFTISGGLGLALVIGQEGMAPGDTSYAVPTGAIGFLFIPPAGNTVGLTFRTNIGDVGSRISKTAPYVEIFDPTALPGSCIITAASTVNGIVEAIFF